MYFGKTCSLNTLAMTHTPSTLLENSNLSWNALKWIGMPQFAGGITTHLEGMYIILEVPWKQTGALPRHF